MTRTATVTRTVSNTLTVSDTSTVTPTPAAPLQLDRNFFAPGLEIAGVAGLAAEDGDYQLSVYNIVGERVRTLAVWKALAGNPFAWPWDGRNDRGEFLGNGVYVLLLRTPSATHLAKVIILK